MLTDMKLAVSVAQCVRYLPLLWAHGSGHRTPQVVVRGLGIANAVYPRKKILLKCTGKNSILKCRESDVIAIMIFRRTDVNLCLRIGVL